MIVTDTKASIDTAVSIDIAFSTDIAVEQKRQICVPPAVPYFTGPDKGEGNAGI